RLSATAVERPRHRAPGARCRRGLAGRSRHGSRPSGPTAHSTVRRMTVHRAPWAKPFLRWAGSKRRLVPVLSACIPDDFGTYFEPFAGSACLFFAIRPRTAVLGDFNPDLMRTYETVRRHPRIVARRLARFGSNAADYYAVRALN